MGNNSNTKDLRKQLRLLVNENMPEVLSAELIAKLRSDLEKEMRQSLDLVHKLVRETLERIDSRQKDVQTMILREFNKPTEQQKVDSSKVD